VERSGLSRSTFYKHFHDKKECFFTAYDAAIEPIWKQVAIALEVREGRGAQLEPLLPEIMFTVLVPCVGVELAAEEDAAGVQ